tara:strand:+ start:4433 stop:4759 length:327 start_codon:yes stop_codon:yes gene_type:complete
LKKEEISIKVTDRNGKSHVFDVPTNLSLNLMEACKANDLDVEGTCGGMAMCASCQCYIISSHKLTEKSFDEKAMLSEAFNVKNNSRLGCQIYLTNEHNGLEIQLAPDE